MRTLHERERGADKCVTCGGCAVKNGEEGEAGGGRGAVLAGLHGLGLEVAVLAVPVQIAKCQNPPKAARSSPSSTPCSSLGDDLTLQFVIQGQGNQRWHRHHGNGVHFLSQDVGGLSSMLCILTQEKTRW